jgi:hypothetical protein
VSPHLPPDFFDGSADDAAELALFAPPSAEEVFDADFVEVAETVEGVMAAPEMPDTLAAPVMADDAPPTEMEIEAAQAAALDASNALHQARANVHVAGEREKIARNRLGLAIENFQRGGSKPTQRDLVEAAAKAWTGNPEAKRVRPQTRSVIDQIGQMGIGSDINRRYTRAFSRRPPAAR